MTPPAPAAAVSRLLALPAWRRRGRPRLAEDQLRIAWQAISLLLEYPSEDLVARRVGIAEAIAGLPEAVREPLLRFVVHLGTTPLRTAQEDYVATFDADRRCCPYLTYFAHGDTRKRGMALVQVKQLYRRAGLEPVTDELPDHLALVLEFGATADAEGTWQLLTDHRPGLEMLRLALAERDSPWADVLAALSATLPPLDGDGSDEQVTAAVRRLIETGPPSEDVGLETAGYLIDPSLTPAPTGPTEQTGAAR